MNNDSSQRRVYRKRGLFGNGRIFGYKKQDNRFVINKEQAEMIRELFELYATGKYSLKQIEEIFWKKGYRNFNDNKVCRSSMAKIIINPKYKGLHLVSRVASDEVLPAIVSEELWEEANRVLRERGLAVIRRAGIYRRVNLLTGKLRCGDCGSSFYRRRGKNGKSKWICGGKLKNGSSCEAFTIDEYELKALILEAVTEIEPDAVTDMSIEDVDKDFVDKYIDQILATPEQGDTMRLEIKLMSGETIIKFVKHIVVRRGNIVSEIRLTVLYDIDRDGAEGRTAALSRTLAAWRARRDAERKEAERNGVNVNSATPQIMRALGINVNSATPQIRSTPVLV